jgi:hypothetical protein
MQKAVDCSCPAFRESKQLFFYWWHAGVLKSASVRAMGRLAFGPGRADGAVAFIQVACSIYLSGLYLPISWVHKQCDYATCIRIGGERKKIRQKGENLHFGHLI